MNKYFEPKFSWMQQNLLLLGVIMSFTMLLLIPTVSFAEETRPLCASCVRIPSYEVENYKTMFPLIIWTDTPTFDHASTITINGYVKSQYAPSPVTVTIRNPIGNIVHIQQIMPDKEGNFAINVDTSSQLWKQDGQYAILAESGIITRSFKTSVDLVPYDVISPEIESKVIPEFGTTAVLILLVSVMSIIILSRKSFTSFVTKI